MQIENMELHHFRNYASQSLSLSPNVNVFVGENAQGKTNALEAMYFLATGRSHRTHKDSDCIEWGQDSAMVHATITTEQRTLALRMELRNTGKKVTVNGVSMNKMTEFIGHIQVVLFAPEDLQLVKGGPQIRRRFVDMELGQTHPKYLYHLSQYHRVLQQRNAMLKQAPVDEDMLGILDDQLVFHGKEVLHRRLLFLEHLQSISANIYETISSGREQFSFVYQSTVPGLDLQAPQNFEDSFQRVLRQKRHSDIHSGHTSAGPHRDDLVFQLNGQAVHSFASQGQQRTIALSLRLAEIDLMERETGELPILLLDDVLSELDDFRQRNLVLNMSERVQTVVTTTSLYHLQNGLSANARLFQVRSGIIQDEG